jgi:drug/metabolite transporter (DMT)-like permease
MSATLIATFAGIITAFCWGSSDYLSARSTKSLNPFQINFASQIAAFMVVGVMFLIFGLHIHQATDWWRIGLSGVLINTAFLIFVKALSGGVVGIIVPLGNIYPLFTILLSLAFLSLRFSAWQITAMVVIVLGAVFLAYEKNHAKLPLKEVHRKTVLALAAAVVWGVGFFVVSPVVGRESWQSITIASEVITTIFVMIVLWLASGRSVVAKAKAAFNSWTVLWIGWLGEAGFLVFYFGSGRSGSVVIPAVLSATGPLIASLWGRLFDHEKVGMIKRLGAVLTVLGVIVLNVV